MFPIKRFHLKSFERGALFRRGELVEILGPGKHWYFDPLSRIRLDVLSTRAPWIQHADLDLLAKSEALTRDALLLDLKDDERALIWIDGRFDRILAPGLHGVFRCHHDARVEKIACARTRFEHPALDRILEARSSAQLLDALIVPNGHAGLVFEDGVLTETLSPGRYAFWRGRVQVATCVVSLRESILELSGQELMTADKVTLRLNALVAYRVEDPRKATTEVEDFKLALYREAQLALRLLVGTQGLDELLSRKEELGHELDRALANKASAMGLRVTGLGIRDLILPGEMKELLNKVTEAKKVAEASVITRREETAAMRSQLNTAKLLEENPTLLRLRELESLERVTKGARLSLSLGENGLAAKLLKGM